MNGPAHFREGEGCLRASDRLRDTDQPAALHEAAMAQAHFLAALAASHATANHPESVAWHYAINTEEPHP